MEHVGGDGYYKGRRWGKAGRNRPGYRRGRRAGGTDEAVDSVIGGRDRRLGL